VNVPVCQRAHGAPRLVSINSRCRTREVPSECPLAGYKRRDGAG